MKYRIKFSKYGSMIFIGHLDIMRYFQKAIRRAALPVKYSEGFSPHQVMSFAAPLGVGIYSTGEYMDVEMEQEISTTLIKEKLQAAMAEGVDILAVKALPADAKNAMASVAAAGYFVRVREGHRALCFGRDFDAFMAQKEIPYQKTTKKSVIDLNLKDGIFDYRTDDGGEDGTAGVYLLLDASSAGNIKPGMVMEAYYQKMGKEPGRFDFVVTREETYTRNEEGALLSLDEVGSIGRSF